MQVGHAARAGAQGRAADALAQRRGAAAAARGGLAADRARAVARGRRAVAPACAADGAHDRELSGAAAQRHGGGAAAAALPHAAAAPLGQHPQHGGRHRAAVHRAAARHRRERARPDRRQPRRHDPAAGAGIPLGGGALHVPRLPGPLPARQRRERAVAARHRPRAHPVRARDGPAHAAEPQRALHAPPPLPVPAQGARVPAAAQDDAAALEPAGVGGDAAPAAPDGDPALRLRTHAAHRGRDHPLDARAHAGRRGDARVAPHPHTRGLPRARAARDAATTHLHLVRRGQRGLGRAGQDRRGGDQGADLAAGGLRVARRVHRDALPAPEQGREQRHRLALLQPRALLGG
mmetsp:Transcript_12382/g.29288  ORF Transcript_12382/g.29288 Transcript_12382/m.29288 type:complete len:349 (+) Transcript_12382:342-1388(+)